MTKQIRRSIRVAGAALTLAFGSVLFTGTAAQALQMDCNISSQIGCENEPPQDTCTGPRVCSDDPPVADPGDNPTKPPLGCQKFGTCPEDRPDVADPGDNPQTDPEPEPQPDPPANDGGGGNGNGGDDNGSGGNDNGSGGNDNGSQTGNNGSQTGNNGSQTGNNGSAQGAGQRSVAGGRSSGSTSDGFGLVSGEVLSVPAQELDGAGAVGQTENRDFGWIVAGVVAALSGIVLLIARKRFARSSEATQVV